MLGDATGIGDDYRQQGVDRHGDDFNVAQCRFRQRRRGHHGDLACDLRQQTRGALQRVLQIDGSRQKTADATALGLRQRHDRRQTVDEIAVSLFRGNAPGGGVRLNQIPIILQRCHVVAYRGRADAKIVVLGQGGGADRLLGADVILDDGTQYQHASRLRHARLLITSGRAARRAARSHKQPCHCFSTLRPGVLIGFAFGVIVREAARATEVVRMRVSFLFRTVPDISEQASV